MPLIGLLVELRIHAVSN